HDFIIRFITFFFQICLVFYYLDQSLILLVSSQSRSSHGCSIPGTLPDSFSGSHEKSSSSGNQNTHDGSSCHRPCKRSALQNPASLFINPVSFFLCFFVYFLIISVVNFIPKKSACSRNSNSDYRINHACGSCISCSSSDHGAQN